MITTGACPHYPMTCTPGRCFEQRFPGLAAVCAKEFGLDDEVIELLRGGRPATNVHSHARAIAMYIGYTHTPTSHVEIADLMGVSHSVGRARIQSMHRRVRSEPEFRALVNALRARWRPC
jgi:chromosomal replication initiation ATPase DnaA